MKGVSWTNWRSKTRCECLSREPNCDKCQTCPVKERKKKACRKSCFSLFFGQQSSTSIRGIAGLTFHGNMTRKFCKTWNFLTKYFTGLKPVKKLATPLSEAMFYKYKIINKKHGMSYKRKSWPFKHIFLARRILFFSFNFTVKYWATDWGTST